MSYIIAYVAFPKSKRIYPVNCFRTDVQLDDQVVVRLVSKGGELKKAWVISIEYLNWDCTNRIECLASEAQSGPKGTIILPPNCPIIKGTSRMGDVCDHLYETGWIRRKPVNKSFRIAYSLDNATQTSNIFFRQNGVDIQVLPIEDDQNVELDSSIGFSPTKEKTVRNLLSHNTVNGLEQVIQFADSFRENGSDYTKYMSFSGSNKRDHRIPTRPENFDRMLYNLFGGDGSGSAYIGDGLSLSPSGEWIDED